MSSGMKAAESLADPEEYPNLFEDWQIALDAEARAAETREKYPPASEYVQHADRSTVNLVETFRNKQIYEEPALENGDLDYEDTEQNGHEAEEGQHDDHVEGHDDGQEEAIVVDAESTYGVVLVNGNEGEEEWVTNNEGKPSA